MGNGSNTYSCTYGQKENGVSSQEKPISVQSKPKGRPPLEPRIAALEKALNETAYRLEQLELRFKQYRVDQSKLAQAQETMVHSTSYVPQFKAWPNQSER